MIQNAQLHAYTEVVSIDPVRKTFPCFHEPRALTKIS